ncbi:MAG: hypothetical protein PVF05_11885 [Gemmatimonadales bacterium]|jgi:hypothetical protein
MRRSPILERIQFLVTPESKDRYRRAAYLDGDSLSAWLRKAADAAAPVDPERTELGSRHALEAFFESQNRRERHLPASHRRRR